MTTSPPAIDYSRLAQDVKAWGRELGFQAVGIAATDLAETEARLLRWLAAGYHGEMEYMVRHGRRRSRPDELVPGTLRVISARLDYFPADAADARATLAESSRAYVSRYALGRDYHRVLRQRLQRLADRIGNAAGPFPCRVFTDSAPVLEKPLAAAAGLGWIGKHTNLLARDAGSWFFLGEIYVGLPLPVDTPVANHCGDCRACIDACPTRAIVAPYELDARRCISYLTIELAGPIPAEFRPLIGNRIFGCDDCQLACPWNRFARVSTEAGFRPRHGLDHAALLELFRWDERAFLRHTEGSAIRRSGFVRWRRNLAVALGNGPGTTAVREALQAALRDDAELVREHAAWALGRLAVTE